MPKFLDDIILSDGTKLLDLSSIAKKPYNVHIEGSQSTVISRRVVLDFTVYMTKTEYENLPFPSYNPGSGTIQQFQQKVKALGRYLPNYTSVPASGIMNNGDGTASLPLSITCGSSTNSRTVRYFFTKSGEETVSYALENIVNTVSVFYLKALY